MYVDSELAINFQRPLAAFLLILGLVACSNDGGDSEGDGFDIIIDSPSVELVPFTKANSPISGLLHSVDEPFVLGLLFPLSEIGYQQQEFFLTGTANSFESIGELGPNGQWTVGPAGRADYTTRILVYRPENDDDFNGTVIVEWLNVTGNFDAAPDWIMLHTELARSGYAWIGVSAQRAGIHGGDGGIDLGLPDLSLKGVNEERYGPLEHPGDSYSYDIFSQAGQAIRYPQEVDPLAGLDVQTIIASGVSQSAIRMMTYVNAIGPKIDLFDAYFIHSRIGSGASLSQAPQSEISVPSTLQVRSDLRVPVLMLMTETDVLLTGRSSLPAYYSRQEDTPSFRLWEIAGAAHGDLYTVDGMSDKGGDPQYVAIEEKSNLLNVLTCGEPINSGPQHFVAIAAMDSLNRWVREGTAPALAPRLEVLDEAGELSFVRDEHGNVLGGIRSPHVDVPIATFGEFGVDVGENTFCFLAGTTTLFSSDKLAALYPSQESYVDAVSASADAAVAARFLIQEDADLIRAAALASGVGL